MVSVTSDQLEKLQECLLLVNMEANRNTPAIRSKMYAGPLRPIVEAPSCRRDADKLVAWSERLLLVRSVCWSLQRAAICLIIPCQSAPTLSNNIIQKGLASAAMERMSSIPGLRALRDPAPPAWIKGTRFRSRMDRFDVA